jgi:hypothetical protein
MNLIGKVKQGWQWLGSRLSRMAGAVAPGETGKFRGQAMRSPARANAKSSPNCKRSLLEDSDF